MDGSGPLLSLGAPEQHARPCPTAQRLLTAAAYVYVFAAVLWLMPGLMTIFIFDEPIVSLTDRIGRWMMFWASFTWSATLGVSAIMLFKQTRSDKPISWRTACVALALPLVNVAVFCIGLFLPRGGAH